jgi:hypothetical protein
MQSTLRQRLEQFSHLNQTLFERLERQVRALSEKVRLLVSCPSHSISNDSSAGSE